MTGSRNNVPNLAEKTFFYIWYRTSHEIRVSFGVIDMEWSFESHLYRFLPETFKWNFDNAKVVYLHSSIREKVLSVWVMKL